MSKIKVYVRVRPALEGEFDAPGCYNCTELEDVSGNWIQIKKDGEPKRYFARVWGPQSTQEEVFRTVGVNTVNDVFEGYYGCIFVYGQTGTGKTFSLGCLTPGLEGIQPRCLQFMFEKIAKESSRYEVQVKQQYVQLYRDSVQDLLDIRKDNMKIRVDETGAVIEGTTTRPVVTYDEAVRLIREGDENRAVANTKMNSASSRSHACLITEVTRKEKATGETTMGRLYLIDLAGSERVSKSGVTGDAYKEAVAINKSLTALGNCIAGLVNGEKVVAFRDSQLTRLLQHSLCGNGRTSIIVTIRPDSPNMQETLCTLKFGERAQKVETQMTPASYREQAVEMAAKSYAQDKTIAEYFQAGRAFRAWAEGIKESIAEREEQLQELDAATRGDVEQLKAAHEKAKKELDEIWKRSEEEINSKCSAELERLRTANASVLKEIDAKVAEAAAKAEDRCSAQSKSLRDEVAKTEKEATKVSREVDAATAESGGGEDGMADPDFGAIAATRLEEVEVRLLAAKRKLRGCRPSRNEGLSVMQLRERESGLREILDKVVRKRDRLLARAEGWDVAAIRASFQRPDAAVVTEFVAKVQEEPEAPPSDYDDDDSSAPPSSEPPPTDSDMDSSDDGSTTDSSTNSDSSSDDSATDSSDGSDASAAAGSDDGGEGGDSDDAAVGAEQVELDFSGPQGLSKQVVTKLKGKLRIKMERRQLDHTLKRDKHLVDLLEQICEYLEYGSPAYALIRPPNDDGKATSEEIKIVKKHLFLAKGRKVICLCDYKPGTTTPDRSTASEMVKLSDLTKVILGQFSDIFLRALEGAPMVPQGTPMPANSSKINHRSLPIFFYRSFSVHDKTRSLIDVVMDQDTDFEAWIVSLHRLTLKDPTWGGPLDISGAKDVARLSEEERRICADCHILPSTFIQTKNNILHKEPRLYYTLFDIRTVSSLDMLHSQKVFEFFFVQGYFERHLVYHIRFMDMLREEEEEKRKKEEVRECRIRIVNMLRKYRPAPTEEIQSFLKTIVGKETEALNELVREYGPEPSADEIAAITEKEEDNRAMGASASSVAGNAAASSKGSDGGGGGASIGSPPEAATKIPTSAGSESPPPPPPPPAGE